MRRTLKARGWDGYYIPAADPHHNEWVPTCWQRRIFLSGFTGSQGDLLVGQDGAWLWTDSRYFIQAEEELAGTGITLCRLLVAGSPSLEQVIADLFPKKIIAVDPQTILARDRDRIEGALKRCDGSLILSSTNLVDEIWEARPPLPSTPLEVYPLSCAGISVMEKIELIRESLGALLPRGEHAFIHPLIGLDAIAWTFNLRGSDIPYNPLAIAFSIITPNDAVLYLTDSPLSSAVSNHLASANVSVRPYQDFLSSLSDYSGTWIVDPAATNVSVLQALEANGATVIRQHSPITLLKAVKNPVEQDGIRAAHIRDAVAVIKLLHWFATTPHAEPITELSLANKLESFRTAQTNYRGPSFPTIAGFGPHGAIVHYQATAESSLSIDESALLLLDSGGHYIDGTTDITRTIHRGAPTREEKELYTLVLKGHLALSRINFPAGTDGSDLDALARAPLWSRGLNYGHGTGHGVGCYLSVHEGPHRIAIGRRSTPLQPGMIVSNEPGFYKAGHFGIRIENLQLVVERPDLSTKEFGEFLGFETLTLVPYSRKLLAQDLLTSEERQQINSYNRQILETLSPLLESSILEWLLDECKELSEE
jgi:Xaa-Pro aminopeptidase